MNFKGCIQTRNTYKHAWFSLDDTAETVYYKCEEQG